MRRECIASLTRGLGYIQLNSDNIVYQPDATIFDTMQTLEDAIYAHHNQGSEPSASRVKRGIQNDLICLYQNLFALQDYDLEFGIRILGNSETIHRPRDNVFQNRLESELEKAILRTTKYWSETLMSMTRHMIRFYRSSFYPPIPTRIPLPFDLVQIIMEFVGSHEPDNASMRLVCRAWYVHALRIRFYMPKTLRFDARVSSLFSTLITQESSTKSMETQMQERLAQYIDAFSVDKSNASNTGNAGDENDAMNKNDPMDWIKQFAMVASSSHFKNDRTDVVISRTTETTNDQKKMPYCANWFAQCMERLLQEHIKIRRHSTNPCSSLLDYSKETFVTKMIDMIHDVCMTNYVNQAMHCNPACYYNKYYTCPVPFLDWRGTITKNDFLLFTDLVYSSCLFYAQQTAHVIWIHHQGGIQNYPPIYHSMSPKEWQVEMEKAICEKLYPYLYRARITRFLAKCVQYRQCMQHASKYHIHAHRMPDFHHLDALLFDHVCFQPCLPTALHTLSINVATCQTLHVIRTNRSLYFTRHLCKVWSMRESLAKYVNNKNNNTDISSNSKIQNGQVYRIIDLVYAMNLMAYPHNSLMLSTLPRVLCDRMRCVSIYGIPCLQTVFPLGEVFPEVEQVNIFVKDARHFYYMIMGISQTAPSYSELSQLNTGDLHERIKTWMNTIPALKRVHFYLVTSLTNKPHSFIQSSLSMQSPPPCLTLHNQPMVDQVQQAVSTVSLAAAAATTTAPTTPSVNADTIATFQLSNPIEMPNQDEKHKDLQYLYDLIKCLFSNHYPHVSFCVF